LLRPDYIGPRKDIVGTCHRKGGDKPRHYIAIRWFSWLRDWQGEFTLSDGQILRYAQNDKRGLRRTRGEGLRMTRGEEPRGALYNPDIGNTFVRTHRLHF